MTEKDLNIAIEKCERIMEFDTRTLKDLESENGWIFEKVYELLKYLRKLEFEGCEDAVPRTSVEYICRKNTVSTNPYEHKYHDKFIQFMKDPEISDFGRWEHSNGFNTALVAVRCDLDKVPSVTPKQPGEDIRAMCGECDAWNQYKNYPHRWIPCSKRLPEREGRYVCTYTYDGKKDVLMFRFEDGDFLVPWYVETVTAWYKPLDPWEGEENGKT